MFSYVYYLKLKAGVNTGKVSAHVVSEALD